MSGLEAYIHGPAEIEKTLDHGVQAVDFLVQNLDRLQSVAVLIVRERLFEILEPQAHGVQRIFYFVRDASGDAAKRGEALADLQLRVDAFERIEIAQSDQRAHAFAVFLNGLHADADAFEPFGGLQFGFRGDFAELIAIEVQRLAQWVARRENLGDAAAEKLSGFAAEKFLRRGTDHHGAGVAGEEQQAVFESGHDRIHVLAKGAEDFVDAPELLADLGNLAADLANFVAVSSEAGEAFHLRSGSVELPRGDAVQLRGNIAQGSERCTADDCRKEG